jgi:hypothetical protein
MNSHHIDPRHAWNRLAVAARTVRDDRDTSAPYGFSTRIAALAMGQELRSVSLFDVFAVRALWVACALAVFSIAVNYSEMPGRVGGASSTAGDDSMLDAVSVILALAD